jgi:hypothetical protein
LPAPLGTRSLRTHPFALDAQRCPGETPVRTALSPRSLIRMRSQVQVLAGPPAIPTGQSAVGSKPGTLAASLGRAGAAPPSPPARPSALPAIHPRGSLHDHHSPWSPTITRTAATRQARHLALRPAPVPSRSRRRQAAPHAGRACPEGQGQARPRLAPDPAGSATDSSADHARPRRGSPSGPRPVPVVLVALPRRPVPRRHA